MPIVDLDPDIEQQLESKMEDITQLGFRLYTFKTGMFNPKYFKLCNKQKETIKEFVLYTDKCVKHKTMEEGELELLQEIYDWAQNYKLNETLPEQTNKEWSKML